MEKDFLNKTRTGSGGRELSDGSGGHAIGRDERVVTRGSMGSEVGQSGTRDSDKTREVDREVDRGHGGRGNLGNLGGSWGRVGEGRGLAEKGLQGMVGALGG